MKLSKEEIIQKIKDSSINKVKVAVADIDGVLRGKVMSRDKFLSVAEGGFGFCDVVFGWDSADVAYDNAAITGWHTGYPDTNAVVDFNTFREVPWDNDIPFFLADFRNKKGDVLSVCPRNLLKSVIAEANKAGFNPYFSQEFEWFNFREEAEDLHATNFHKPNPISPGMFGYSILRSSMNSEYFNDLFDLLTKFGIPIEGIHTETGPGVYEAAILYADALEAADRAVLFKTGVKEIAAKHGITATFMAKYSETLPGCSGHVHQSLSDKDNKNNLFYDERRRTKMSSLMEHYIAGQLYCLPHILPMFAPTVNSYKRLVVGAWAPTTVTWGMDNRTTALRVIMGGAKSSRLETRVVGSDSNPYLAIAACLASGLYGVKKKMSLTVKPTIGSGYTDKKRTMLPKTLQEATARMAKSDIPAKLFGKDFTEHFIGTREWEWRQFSKVVTDWELRRYFEII